MYVVWHWPWWSSALYSESFLALYDISEGGNVILDCNLLQKGLDFGLILHISLRHVLVLYFKKYKNTFTDI